MHRPTVYCFDSETAKEAIHSIFPVTWISIWWRPIMPRVSRCNLQYIPRRSLISGFIFLHVFLFTGCSVAFFIDRFVPPCAPRHPMLATMMQMESSKTFASATVLTVCVGEIRYGMYVIRRRPRWRVFLRYLDYWWC